ncbi:uncharacterized protein LOC134529429 isoform X2 [Bacillus rossius redtenbacheri]|uniref:uncharacterized protein LOC134529429 isoform X2 n=1 Tax=Bacillus rossius redtenbacheri TaxID=93214 RepID=UPI002FDEDED2
MLVLFCMFLGMAVIHLKIRQIEMEEKLSLQMDILHKISVQQDLQEKIFYLSKSILENSGKISSIHLSNLSDSTDKIGTSTNSQGVFKKKNDTTQLSGIKLNSNFVNTRPRYEINFGKSEGGSDISNLSNDAIVHVRNLNIVNKSSLNKENMSDVILKTKLFTDVLNKNVSASGIFEKLHSSQRTPIFPYVEWTGNSTNPEEWNTEGNERATKGNVLSRVVRSNRRKGKKHRQPLPQSGRTRPRKISRDRGIIAPWFQDKAMSGNFGAFQYDLKEGGLVEMSEAGLYLIYAQVYYMTTELHNSFAINIMENGKTQTLLAMCSANSCPNIPGSLAELSCFTSVVRFLNVGDQVFVLQRERNRRILMREGQSFLGLVKLNSLSQKN